MPYCLPLACQSAAELPSELIQGLTVSVMSISLPDWACVASAPPPHCWKMLGGSLDCSATGTFVFSASFWVGEILKVTFGWALVYASATDCQTPLAGSWSPLCHQLRVTGPVSEAFGELEPLELEEQPLAAAAKTTVAASANAPHRRRASAG